jgi:hypothetical protein
MPFEGDAPMTDHQHAVDVAVLTRGNFLVERPECRRVETHRLR